MRSPRDLGWLILALTNLLGLAAFGYPFLLSDLRYVAEQGGHTETAPLIFLLLGPALLALVLAELSSGRLSPRSTAVLGVLAGVVAVLRIPAGPGDTPTFFFVIILAGYVYGARFGFLLGALGLLVSALLTGGVGPWMPFQMFVTGWMGMSAGWLGAAATRLRIAPDRLAEVALLAAFGYGWGLLFGALMNLWFWPFSPPSAITWQPGLGLAETLRRYGQFYALTSFAWDSARAIGNVALILLLGRPIVRLLRRFQRQFQFRVLDSIQLPPSTQPK